MFQQNVAYLFFIFPESRAHFLTKVKLDDSNSCLNKNEDFKIWDQKIEPRHKIRVENNSFSSSVSFTKINQNTIEILIFPKSRSIVAPHQDEIKTSKTWWSANFLDDVSFVLVHTFRRITGLISPTGANQLCQMVARHSSLDEYEPAPP